jgi:hypothetical protein
VESAPPGCSTVKSRRFEKCLILKDFSAVSKRWRRGRDSHPRLRALTHQKNPSYAQKHHPTAENTPCGSRPARIGAGLDLYRRCTDFSPGRLICRSKIAKVPILWGFVWLERAKGIEPSYAAWEAYPKLHAPWRPGPGASRPELGQRQQQPQADVFRRENLLRRRKIERSPSGVSHAVASCSSTLDFCASVEWTSRQ